jgi:hypothetical protein
LRKVSYNCMYCYALYLYFFVSDVMLILDMYSMMALLQQERDIV